MTCQAAPLIIVPYTMLPVPDGVMASSGVVTVVLVAVFPTGLAAWPVTATTVRVMPLKEPVPDEVAVTAVVVTPSPPGQVLIRGPGSRGPQAGLLNI